jgi:3-oxoacyl-[acyl-carrier-protein] synthase-1
MTAEVHIVATGARTPVGLSAESSAAAVRAGVSRLAEHPTLLDAEGDPLRCARDAHLIPALPATQRMVTMARHALEEVARKVMVVTGRSLDVPVVLAMPAPRPGFRASDAERVAQEIATTPLPGILVAGVRWTLDGHAGVFRATHAVMQMLAGREQDLCVVCGVDSYFDADTLRDLESRRQVAREDVRDGFLPGEAACAVLLARDDACVRLGLPSLARVRGAGLAQEERPVTSPVGLLGEGLTEALVGACADLRAPEELVDEVFCDINGERHRSDEWGFAMLRAPGLFRDAAAYRMTADVWGDVGAATGALGCMLAARAWERGYARGPRALVWGSSLAGLRGAVLLENGRG